MRNTHSEFEFEFQRKWTCALLQHIVVITTHCHVVFHVKNVVSFQLLYLLN